MTPGLYKIEPRKQQRGLGKEGERNDVIGCGYIFEETNHWNYGF
jgi:hypothetical protein